MPHSNRNSQQAILDAAAKRKRLGTDRKIKITKEKEAIARDWGNGSLTDGIDKLFTILPVFSRAKAIIELALEHLPPEKQAIAEAVLLELEDLEIEQAYHEAEIEATISFLTPHLLPAITPRVME